MSHLISGRYEVQSVLGSGGFGKTFLARDTQTGSQVAIKMLDTRKASDWKAFELFEREATVLRSLRHHGIPEVLGTVREPFEGTEAAFLVMEYIEGTSLAKIIEERQHLDSAAVLTLALELLGILEYLHGRVPPVLHRDIKPANIIVRPGGAPALVDFGAVRSVFKAAGESGATVAGTYGYMPYEQYMGQASPASDLYALGATLLHLLTGRAPPEFMSEEGRIVVPEALPGEPRLGPVIARLLRPSPAERFQRAGDVRAALLAAPAGTAVALSGSAPGVALVVKEVLPPAPREIEGPAKTMLDKAAPNMWELMSASEKMADDLSIVSAASFLFFSVITAGVLPAVFFVMAYERKRRVKRFLRGGTEAIATIHGMTEEATAFGEKITRVAYEFTADGVLRADSDTALPVVARRWKIGGQVRVLYLADKDYDSVIVGT